MLLALREFVRNVLVIVVLAAFLQLILPPGTMRRYANLAVSLVLVLTLMGPLLALTRASWDVHELLGQAQAQTAWSEIKVRSELLQQQNDASLLQSYRQILKAQVGDIVEQQDGLILVDCEIALVEDQAAKDFGSIVNMQVVCAASETVKSVHLVESIEIGQPSAIEQEQNSLGAEVQTQLQAIQQALARFFFLDVDQVQVAFR